jgi:uncharacterized repeat protein (TIGR01451 family)
MRSLYYFLNRAVLVWTRPASRQCARFVLSLIVAAAMLVQAFPMPGHRTVLQRLPDNPASLLTDPLASVEYATSLLDLYPNLAFAQGGVITKTGPSTTFPGNTILYPIFVYKETGSDWLTGTVWITDTAPANTGSPSGAPEPGVWSYTNLGGGVGRFRNDVLIAGTGLITVGTFNVVVNSPLANGTVITNTAYLSTPTGTAVSPIVTTTVRASDFSIVKYPSSSPVCAGSLLTYTVAVSNINPDPLNLIVVPYTETDLLPSQVSLVYASGSPVTSTGMVIWTMSNVATESLWGKGANTVTRTAVVSVPYSLNNGITLTNYITVFHATVLTASYVLPVTVTKVTPDFTSNSPVPFVVPVVFTNTTSGDATFAWNFGDGGTSTAVNPTHSYTSGGVFTVTLAATSARGCGTLTVTHPITVMWPVTLTWNGITTDIVRLQDGAAGLAPGDGSDGSFILALNLGGNVRTVANIVLTSTQPPLVQWDTISGNGTSVLGVYSATTRLNNPADGTFTQTLAGTPSLILYGSDTSTPSLFPPGLYTYCVTVNFTDSGVARACATIQPSLHLRKSDSPDPVQAGGTLTYTLVYSHDGSSTVVNAWLTDTLPLSVTLNASAPPTTTQSGNLAGWNLGNLPAYSSGQIVMTVTVASPIISGTVLTNMATITAANALSATALATTTVWSSHALTVTKAAAPNPVQAGAILTYTIAYTVTGNEPAVNALVTDAVPVSTVFRSASGGISPVGGVLTWTLGTRYPPASGLLTFTVQVTSPLANGTVLTNTARFADSNGGRPVSATVTTTVQSAPQLVTATLAWNGITTDTVRLADDGAGLVPDGQNDGSFILGLNLGGSVRTVASIVLTSTQPPLVQWDTISGDGTSVLGVYSATTRLNNPDGTLAQTLAGTPSFVLYGSDVPPGHPMYSLFAPGLYTYCVTVNFTDSSVARACATISPPPAGPVYLPLILLEYPPPPPTPTPVPCFPTDIGTVGVGNWPHGVAVDPGRNEIYVANYAAGTVSVINGDTNSVVNTIASVPYANGVAYDAVHDLVYVTNKDTGKLTVIQASSKTVLTPTISVGTQPNGVAYNPTADKIYVANFGAGSVTILNGTTRALITTIGGLNQPSHIAVDPGLNKVYVSNHAGPWVTRIDGASNGTATIPLYDCYGPYGIAVDTVRHLVYVATIDTQRIVAIDANSDAYLGWAQIKKSDGTPVPLRVIGVNPVLGSSGHLYVTTAESNNGFNKILVIPKGWPEYFSLPYAIDSGRNPIEGVAVNLVTNKVYVSAELDNLVTYFLDGEPACLWNLAQGGGFILELGPRH